MSTTWAALWILYFFHGESLRYFSFPFSNVLMSLSPFVMSLPDAFLRFSLRNVNKVTKKVFTLHFVTNHVLLFLLVIMKRFTTIFKTLVLRRSRDAETLTKMVLFSITVADAGKSWRIPLQDCIPDVSIVLSLIFV